MEAFDMLCLGSSCKGPAGSLAVLSHLPIRFPSCYPFQGQRQSCSVVLGRQIARYLYNLGQMNIDSRLTWIFKLLFSSVFLIEIDKFREKMCFLLKVSALMYLESTLSVQ